MKAKPPDAWRTTNLLSTSEADLTVLLATRLWVQPCFPSKLFSFGLHPTFSDPITPCLVLSQGSVPTCAYFFQPDMLVMRVVEVSILEPDVPFPQTLLSHASYLK